MRENVAPKDLVVNILLEFGVRPSCVRDYASICSTGHGHDGLLDYSKWMDEALRLREQPLGLRAAFERQLESLLKCGAVECDSDEVQEMLDALDFDESGYVSVGTVRTLMLKDGRIARRTQVVNEELRAAVPDFVVEQRVRAERGETRKRSKRKRDGVAGALTAEMP
eukprot:Skav206479  [mRNA]  locus=scaffold1672:420518:423708:- [translate_table: standard]